jgi:hypothetical protein
MEFSEARTAALEEIRSEPADNGIHAAWIHAKTAAVERMTEESYSLIIRRGEKDSWDEDYQVACLIRRYMNGSVRPKAPAQKSS